MKKLFSILLALALAFALCACDGVAALKNIELPPLPTETVAPAAVTPTESPIPTEEPATAEPQVIVAISKTEKKDYDPQNGSTLILTFSYDTPTVHIEGNDKAAAAINEYAALLDESYYTGENYGDGSGTGYNNMLTLAEDNYNIVSNMGGDGGMYEMVSSRTVTVERSDARVLTLLYNDYSFTGGAHGFYGERAYCFDVQTGELLTLSSLSTDAEKLKTLLTERMVNTVENDASVSDRIDKTLIPDDDYSAALSTLLRDGSWYFGKEGLVIFSDLYELSSYAAGPLQFTVPYDKLSSVVDEKWLPKETKDTASFSIVDADSMVDGSTVIIDKVTANKDGKEMYLVLDGRANNINISTVEYSEEFYVTAQLWNCSYMSDCALQLQTIVPEGMPNLMISYSDKDGVHKLYVSESGKDGSLILVDDSIEAVG